MVVTLTRDSSLEFDNDKIISHKQVVAKIKQHTFQCLCIYFPVILGILEYHIPCDIIIKDLKAYSRKLCFLVLFPTD